MQAWNQFYEPLSGLGAGYLAAQSEVRIPATLTLIGEQQCGASFL